MLNPAPAEPLPDLTVRYTKGTENFVLAMVETGAQTGALRILKTAGVASLAVNDLGGYATVVPEIKGNSGDLVEYFPKDREKQSALVDGFSALASTLRGQDGRNDLEVRSTKTGSNIIVYALRPRLQIDREGIDRDNRCVLAA